MAEQWLSRSGSTFEASKTGCFHIERSPAADRAGPSLEFSGSTIRPQNRIKTVGIGDSKLQRMTRIDEVVTAARLRSVSHLGGYRDSGRSRCANCIELL